MKKNKKILIIVGLLVLVIVISFNFKKQHDSKLEVKTETNPYLSANIEIKTFEGGMGWGYDISIDGLVYVHQPNIPALSGESGFENELEARQVAEIVVSKIRNNILPPSVTVEEVQVIISQ
jgi:hypothetical protein